MLKQDISIEVLFAFATILILLLLSALVSGSEIAFFSFSESDIEKLENSDNKKDQQILHILKDKKKLLATILISNNFINVGIIILSNFVISHVFNFGNHLVEILINVVLVTTFLVFFGEVMPKILASKINFAFARTTYPLIKFFEIFFYFPLGFLLSHFGNFLDSKIKRRKDSINLSEIEKAIELGVDDDTIVNDKKLLKGIVHFGNTTVKQIMKPRVDIFAIDIEENFEDVLLKIRESGYSRIPVYKENLDTIKGVLYIKDLLEYISKPKDFKWQEMLRNADYTSEAKKIDDLLREMQESKLHMSIVVDEYGGTEGLVTLEDIIEEVVGEINDEFDQSKEEYKKSKDGSYIFEGKTPLLDVCKQTGIEIGTFEEAKEDSDTLAGLVLEINGNMPKEGKTIIFDKYEFKILKISKRRIDKIKLKIN